MNIVNVVCGYAGYLKPRFHLINTFLYSGKLTRNRQRMTGGGEGGLPKYLTNADLLIIHELAAISIEPKLLEFAFQS